MWPDRESLDDGSLILTGVKMMLFVNVSASKSLHQDEEYTTVFFVLMKALTNNIILTPVNIKEPSSSDPQSGHFIIW